MVLRHYIGRPCLSPCEVIDHVLAKLSKTTRTSKCDHSTLDNFKAIDRHRWGETHKQLKSIQVFGSLLLILVKAPS